MRYKEIIKILKSITSLNDEDKFKRDLIVESFERELRFEKYFYIGVVIFFAGMLLGWSFSFYSQWSSSLVPKLTR